MAIVATSGKNSECEAMVPVTKKPDRERRVVMRLPRKPGVRGSYLRVPELRPGDRLRVTAEVEVTTDCKDPRNEPCYENPYGYAPKVWAYLLLSADPDATRPKKGVAVKLGRAQRTSCSHTRHHQVIVFRGESYLVPESGLPWSGPSYVNLVLDAHNGRARAGDVLLVGENEPDGKTVGQDKGRINAIRLRPAAERCDRRQSTTKRLVRRIPVDKERKTVVYSEALEGLEAGEQLDVRARLRVRNNNRHPARISTRLILTDDPKATDDSPRLGEITDFNGEISENNGFNCLPKSKSRSHKVGVLRCRKRPPRGKRMYVNLIAVSGDPTRSLRPGGADKLDVLDEGLLEVRRYGNGPGS